MARQSLIAIALLMLAGSQAAAQLRWELRAPLEDPRTGGGVEGAAASLIDDKIYISHGFRGFDSVFLSVYDIQSNTWTHGGPSAPNATFPRAEMGGGVAFGKHYAIGGRNGPNANNEEFDPVTRTWATRAPMSVARGGLGLASWGDKIYAIGGRTGSAFGSGTILNLNEVYDPVTDTWTTLAPLPMAVSDSYATVAYSGKVYVFGGAADPFAVINAVQIYDIASNSWSAGAAMPTARAAAMAGVIGNQIAVFGGFDPATDSNLAVTELYNPMANTWSAGPDMLEPVSEISQGVTHNGTEIYSIGTGIFGEMGSVVQVLVAQGKCNTICFRSPQHYLLNLSSLPPGAAVMIGGVNFNVPTQSLAAIKLALQGGTTPLQRLNRQFVAAQLSLIRAGGLLSPPVFNALWSNLNCYDFNFAPMALSNGSAITPNSPLNILFEQSRFAIRDNRTADMLVLADLFSALNGNDPLGRCGRPLPDLAPVGVGPNGTFCQVIAVDPVPPGGFFLSVFIQNQGDADSTVPTTATVVFAGGIKVEPDPVLSPAGIPPLKVGETRGLRFRLPPGPLSSLLPFTITVDSKGVVKEKNEMNNIVTVTTCP
jgi:hypothetical protein